MEKTLVCVCGFANTGKSVVSEYLVAQYGVHAFSDGEIFAERLREAELPNSRRNYAMIVGDFIEEDGPAHLADLRMPKLEGLPHRVFVNHGTRLLGALARYREHFPRVEVIALTASPETRLARARARREKAGEAELTMKQLLAEDNFVSEREIGEIMKQATARIENDLDTPDILYADLDRIMHEWKLV